MTDRQKQLIVELISQVSFKVGQSELAKEYEAIVKELQPIDTKAVKGV